VNILYYDEFYVIQLIIGVIPFNYLCILLCFVYGKLYLDCVVTYGCYKSFDWALHVLFNWLYHYLMIHFCEWIYDDHDYDRVVDLSTSCLLENFYISIFSKHLIYLHLGSVVFFLVIYVAIFWFPWILTESYVYELLLCTDMLRVCCKHSREPDLSCWCLVHSLCAFNELFNKFWCCSIEKYSNVCF